MHLSFAPSTAGSRPPFKLCLTQFSLIPFSRGLLTLGLQEEEEEEVGVEGDAEGDEGDEDEEEAAPKVSF